MRRTIKPNSQQVVTVTVTQSATTGVPIPACTNYGLEFAAYSYVGNPDPTPYKSATPELTGVTNTYHYSTADYPNDGGYPEGPQLLYGEGPIPTDEVAVDHRGYFIADQTGTYSFAPGYIDDYFYLWIGETAYSGWDASNADISDPDCCIVPTAYTTYLTTGVYPIRFMWINQGGPGAYSITITAPDGTVLESPNMASSNYLVTDCVAAGAIPYEPYGSET